jgi:uncharacterized protein DUF4189
MIGFRRFAAAVAAASLLLAPVSAAQAAGAFAVGACGAYGYAFDYKEGVAARAAAAHKCSGTCKIVGALRRDCAALAVDAKNPCGSYGWAVERPSRHGAKHVAATLLPVWRARLRGARLGLRRKGLTASTH